MPASLFGVFLDYLLKNGAVTVVAGLTQGDVKAAKAVWLVNSVRGWVPFGSVERVRFCFCFSLHVLPFFGRSPLGKTILGKKKNH